MKFIISILLLITCSLSSAQNYYSENITSNNGLPNNAIRSLFQDSRGYMWVGTDAGVSRWDGETFINYNTLDGLIGNKVWWIDEDNNGDLWFACFGAGISKFDGLNFTSYSSSDGLVDNSVRVVKYSPYFNCLLIGTNKSISVLKDTAFHNFSVPNGCLEKDVIITAIMEDKNHAVFFDFANHHYVLKINGEGRYILNRLKNNWLWNYGICSSAISSDGDTIIGWFREGVVIKKNDSTIEIPAIGQVFGIAEDNQDNLWAASWNGNSLSPPGGLFLIDDSKPMPMNPPYKLKSIQGWSLFFESTQNLIFYGTLNNGLYKIPPKYFEYYSPAFFNENDLSVKKLVIDDKDNKWLITDSILICWNGNDFQKMNLSPFFDARYQFEIHSDTVRNITAKLETLSENYYTKGTTFADIELDKDNNVWFAINMLGLFNLPDNNCQNNPVFKRNIESDFAFDKSDTLFQCHEWFRCLVKSLDFKKSVKVAKYEDKQHPINLKKMISHNNEIWLCSRIDGVFLYKSGMLRTLTSEDSAINKIVNDICFDNEGRAYLGGNDGRIEILDKETRKKIFEFKTEGQGRSVHWLKISKNRLFVGFSDVLGVYHLDSIKNKKVNCQIFTESEGYFDRGIGSSYLDSKGNIWLATTDGLVSINTDLFIDIEFKPLKTKIEKVEIFNEKTNWSQLVKADAWSGLPKETPELRPEQNHISIYYHTLNYSNINADLYYFKLAGIDKEWVGPTNKNYVVYPYLNAGEYTFSVKSKNNLSGLFTNPATFSFIILKPWYKQTWFILFVAIIIFAMVTLLYRFKINLTRKQEEKKRAVLTKISELETTALQAQMNPHFLFNALNSIQNYMLDHNVDDALTYLSSFSKIIRMTLEFADHKHVKLNDILTYLEHYVKLENMRFDDLFDYEVVCQKEIDTETTQMPPMILQTLIENAIKHGIRSLKHKGKIKLEIIKIDNESFKCAIEDNGVGRARAAQINQDQNINKESRGLKIIRERLKLLNNGKSGPFKMEIIDLYTKNGKPAGTRVEITLAFDF